MTSWRVSRSGLAWSASTPSSSASGAPSGNRWSTPVGPASRQHRRHRLPLLGRLVTSRSPSSGPLYGSLLKAWQCFLSSANRLASLHASICRSLVSEDGDRVRTWQKDTFHKKLFGGFKESQDAEMGFIRAQKPWAKRLKKVRIPFERVQILFCPSD